MQRWKKRGYWFTLLTLLLGWILNHLLDYTMSGTARVWWRLLTVASLGSQKLRDAPFEAAAINPFPIPASEVWQWIVVGFGVFAIFATARTGKLALRFIRAKRGTPVRRLEDEPIHLLEKRVIRGFMQLGASLLFIFAADVVLFIPLFVNKEAIAARRIFEADKEIIAPYQTPAEQTQLQADFAGMETKAQFEAIMARIRAVADARHVKIHPYNF